jgi:predicted RNase H-like HicB family nuclease
MELKFDVRVEDGLLVAVCDEPHMATHGRTMEELINMVRELIACHFDEGDARREAKPRFILHEETALAYG